MFHSGKESYMYSLTVKVRGAVIGAKERSERTFGAQCAHTLHDEHTCSNGQANTLPLT